MTPPIEINGQTVSDVVVNGQSVDQVTANGQEILSPLPVTGGLRSNYDATTLSNTSGESPDNWPDIESGLDLPSEGSPIYEPDLINGNAGVFFDGVDDRFFRGDLDSKMRSRTEFLVAEYLGGRNIAAHRGGTTAIIWRAEGDDIQIRTEDGTSVEPALPYSSETMLLAVVIDGTGDDIEVSTRLDGSETETATLSTDSEFEVARRSIGDDAAGRFGECNVGEWVIYHRALNNDEITDVESHLADKWDIGI